MKITFLVDNNSLIDQYYISEPGLSILLEDGEKKILLDTGYSDAFLRNGLDLGVDFNSLDYLVFSHGHFDHTWGLPALIRHYTNERIRGAVFDNPVVVAHPFCFNDKVTKNLGSIGSFFNEETLAQFFPLELSREPKWLSDKVLFLGEIPKQFDFEKAKAYNQRKDGDKWIEDKLIDDTSLALVTEEGLVLVTGCAHRGVCSTLERAMELTGVRKVRDVVGGFHLLNAPKERMDKTIQYLKENQVKNITPCHCVDLQAKIQLASEFQLCEVGSGKEITF